MDSDFGEGERLWGIVGFPTRMANEIESSELAPIWVIYSRREWVLPCGYSFEFADTEKLRFFARLLGLVKGDFDAGRVCVFPHCNFLRKHFQPFSLNLVLPSVKPSGAMAKRGTRHLT